MKHARNDYDNIQEIETNGTVRRIPADEPVFLIRGQDVVAGDAVRAWSDLAEKAGAAPDIVAVARNHAAKMDAWPKKKVPDLKKAEARRGVVNTKHPTIETMERASMGFPPEDESEET